MAFAQSLGARSETVLSDPIANPNLNEAMSKMAQQGRTYAGGTISKGYGIDDFAISFDLSKSLPK